MIEDSPILTRSMPIIIIFAIVAYLVEGTKTIHAQ